MQLYEEKLLLLSVIVDSKNPPISPFSRGISALLFPLYKGGRGDFFIFLENTEITKNTLSSYKLCINVFFGKMARRRKYGRPERILRFLNDAPKDDLIS